MTKKDIYRIALATFNIDIDKLIVEKDDEHPEVSKEIMFCDAFYRNAECSCAKVYNWTFLYSMRKYEEKDLYEPYSSDHAFAYPVPDDFGAAMYVNGKYNSDIQRIGAYLIFKVKNPEFIYITDRLDFDNWSYPDDYGYLVAYKLAMEICGNVAPDSNSYNNAMQKYGLVLQQLRNAEIKSKRRKNPSEWTFVY